MASGSGYGKKKKSATITGGIVYDRRSTLNRRDTRKLAIFNESLKEALAVLPEDQQPKIYPATLSERLSIIPLFCTAKYVNLLQENRALRGILPHALIKDPTLIHRINAAIQAAAHCPKTVRPKGEKIAKNFGLHADI